MTGKERNMAGNWRKCRPRKRPTVVHARDAEPGEVVRTRAGAFIAQPGDLVVLGAEGKEYLIDRGIFAKSYEWVDGE